MIDCMTLNAIYQKQIEFQKMLIEKGIYNFSDDVVELPKDNIEAFSYHVQQLVSEIGEVLDSDKRWKSYRNTKYESENKKEEIADCFIVLMNIAIFSGIDSEELEKTILNKIDENAKRLQSL